jgi:uncharacterized protein (DUF885 family)
MAAFGLARACARALLALACILPAPALAAPAGRDLAGREDEFLRHWLELRPHAATRLGLHDRDARLVPVTQASLAAELGWQRDFRARLAAVPRAGLTPDRALERDLLAARVEREILDLEAIRPYETDPHAYLELARDAVQSVLERDPAAPCERVRAAARRLTQVPEVLRAARVNLAGPARLATEAAIEGFERTLHFYREAVPVLAGGCRDPGLQASLAEADSTAVRALEEFLVFLREDLLPRSNGSFALGSERHQRLLACAEMEASTPESLLARAGRALEETRRREQAAAGRIAPGLGVAAALDSLARTGPAPDSLPAAARAALDRVRTFLRSRDLASMPARVSLPVRETPFYRRGSSPAALALPGVWEMRPNGAHYEVSPPDPEWTPERRRAHLASFGRGAADIVTLREVLPGRYLQFLARRQLRSRLRQAFPSAAGIEGWSHYAEQAALEEGYGRGDPRVELAQLVSVEREIVRLIASLSLHTQGMSLEQAAELFVTHCGLGAAAAADEARHCALDPDAGAATLGRWRILELREEARARLGPRFRLRAFHDALLRQGGVPLPLAREAVLRQLGAAARGGE